MAWWFKIPLWARVIGGLVLGGALGLALRGAGQEAFVVAAIKPFGDAFVNLIRMLIAPLIFTTLTAGVLAMGDPKKLGSVGVRAIGLYLLTTWVAVSLGLLFGTLLQPGRGVDTSLAGADAVAEIEGKLKAAEASQGIAKQLLAIIPDNPVEALARTDVLAVIFFSILFGVGVLMAKEAGKAIGAVIESAANATIKLTELIMETAPFGVFALMTWVMATRGLAILDNLLLLAVALYAACILHALFVYGFLVRVIARLPMWRFFRGMADAQAVAFSTASSNATLPVTIACVTDNLGVKKSVAGSVLPLGATINMDGTAIYLGLVALFAAQALGIAMTPGMFVTVALAATLASIGAAGIPSASLFLAAAVLQQIGVTPEQAVLVVAFIFPFDRLLDMMRTMTNVTGDAAVAVTVAQWEGEIDEAVFRAPNKV